MTEKHINLLELIRNCPDTTIHIRAGDLHQLGRQLIAELRLEIERQQYNCRMAQEETYISPETVRIKLGISESTLYRLAKNHLLEPVYVGGQRRYKLSDLTKLVSHS